MHEKISVPRPVRPLNFESNGGIPLFQHSLCRASLYTHTHILIIYCYGINRNSCATSQRGYSNTMSTSIAPSRHNDNDIGFLSLPPSTTEGSNTPATSDVAGSSGTEEIELSVLSADKRARPVSQGSAESQASQNDVGSIGSDHIPTSDPRPDSATFNRRQVQMLSICTLCSIRCLFPFRCLNRKWTIVSIRTIFVFGGTRFSASCVYFHGKCIVQCHGSLEISKILIGR